MPTSTSWREDRRGERQQEREQRREQGRRERHERMLARQQARTAEAQAKALPAGQTTGGKAKKAGRPIGEPKPTPSKIALRSIDGHITRTASVVTAWYRLAPKPWSFRGDGQREQLIDQIAGQLGALKGHWLHLRVTSRPYPIGEWAYGFHDNAIDRLDDVDGALSWADFLEGEQQHLQDQGMSEKEVFLGVEISRRDTLSQWLGAIEPVLGKVFARAATAELEVLHQEIERTDALVREAGLDAEPATAAEMAWLMRRSVALGLPAPANTAGAGDGRWETEDLPGFTDGVAMVAEPYDPVLKVIGTVDGERVERYLVVLTVGPMNPLDIPQSYPPWMVRADAARTPVEWSARLRVREDAEVNGELRLQMGRVRSQVRHYSGDHDQPPPQRLARQVDQVQQIEEELSTTGLHAHHARVYGWWRIAVSGRTETEAIDNARKVFNAYNPHIKIEHPEAQYKLAREFIPGEPLATTGYRRRGPTRWAAAAVPAVTATIGDRHGVLLGRTDDAARQPVAWDPWLAQEARRMQGQSGLTAVVGGLGAGKSFLTGLLIYKTLRAGARWTVLDPSGPLAALTRLPELAPYSRHIHLLDAAPGILNPYRVVAEPRREDYTDKDDPQEAFEREQRKAASTRRNLAYNTLLGLLPRNNARQPETATVLTEAVSAVGGRPDRHLGEVIDVLRERANAPDRSEDNNAQHAGGLAALLEERRDQPQAALLFPEPGGPDVDPWDGDADIRLTVLTLQGLSMPSPGSSPESWSDAEALNVELLNLASWLTQRAIYTLDANLRKGVVLDEAHFLTQTATGKALIDRLARDSRKFNVRALFASQLAGDLLQVPGFAGLLNATFVGRTTDTADQLDALRLLKVPTNMGYERVLGELSSLKGTSTEARSAPREFVFADGFGGTEKITIDLGGGHLEHVLAALVTDPNARQARRPARRSPPPSTPALAPVEPETSLTGGHDDEERVGPEDPESFDEPGPLDEDDSALEDTLDHGVFPLAAERPSPPPEDGDDVRVPTNTVAASADEPTARDLAAEAVPAPARAGKGGGADLAAELSALLGEDLDDQEPQP